ncbi:MAG: hypothetical protein A2Y17_01590 [Clostridiales bacterium GWF2_38_85]|nr:MAG: hypothetical protein A2Y17_01590 [Clostridiales bacterium GWF2_38_85]HBL84799.1 hypothetical protein [Clostridiales bacterium]
MNKKILSNKNGSSLLEVLIGGTLIAIASVMMVTSFMTALNLIRQSLYIKDQGLIASSVIEGAIIADSGVKTNINPDGNMIFEIDSVKYEISGSFTSAYDTTGKVGFVIFEADSQQ